MQRYLAEGLAAAEAAAQAARTGDDEIETPLLGPATARRDLTAALEAFDEPVAQATLDQLLASTTVDAVLTQVVLPFLHDLGDRWERGEATIAQEHFASSLLRGRMLGLARGWGRGLGPLALLACLPAEQHELGLIAFGLALRSRGWRIAYLGSDTPLATIEEAVQALEPSLVVLNSVTGERVDPIAPQLRTLARACRLALGGEGARQSDPAELGALALTGDPVGEAERVTTLTQSAAG
jgi:methanogenic corrinoid protein MtbC1